MLSLCQYGKFIYFLCGIPVYTEEGSRFRKLEVAYCVASTCFYLIMVAFSAYENINLWVSNPAQPLIQYYWNVATVYYVCVLAVIFKTLVNKIELLNLFETAVSIERRLRLEWGPTRNRSTIVLNILLIMYYVICPIIDVYLMTVVEAEESDFGTVTAVITSLANLAPSLAYWTVLYNQTLMYALESDWLDVIFSETLAEASRVETVPPPEADVESPGRKLPPPTPSPTRRPRDALRCDPGSPRDSVQRINNLLGFYFEVKKLRLRANQFNYLPGVAMIFISVIFYPVSLLNHAFVDIDKGNEEFVLGGYHVLMTIYALSPVFVLVAFNQMTNSRKGDFMRRLPQKILRNDDIRVGRKLIVFLSSVRNKYEDTPFILFDLDYGVLAAVLSSSLMILTTLFSRRED